MHSNFYPPMLAKSYLCHMPMLSNIAQLSSSTRDEEPLVDTRVNWSRSEVLILGNGRKLFRSDAGWRLLNGEVGAKARQY